MVLVQSVTLVDLLLQFLLPFYLFLVKSAFSLLEIFLKSHLCLLLYHVDLLSKVLSIQSQFLSQLLDQLFLFSYFFLANCFDLFELIVCLFLHFIDFDIQGIVISDKSLPVLLLYHSDEVVFAICPLQPLPDSGWIILFLCHTQENLNEAEVGN